MDESKRVDDGNEIVTITFVIVARDGCAFPATIVCTANRVDLTPSSHLSPCPSTALCVSRDEGNNKGNKAVCYLLNYLWLLGSLL